MQPGTSGFRYSLLLREIDRLRAQSGVSAVALILVHLDGLAEVNDTFGYVAGDKVLEEFASRLAGVRRAQDHVFGISCTSFAFLIHNPLHEGHAVLGAEKVSRVAAEPVLIGGGRARLRPRMGISLLPNPAMTAEDLLRQCELAVAEARVRDETYVVYTPLLNRMSTATGAVRFDVEDALAQGEFELHYQPKMDLAANALSGAEALIRWRHPRQGLLGPAQFIPAIEGGQSIRSMLRFVLHAAMRQVRPWLASQPGFSVAVNVAPGNLDDPDLLEVVESALRIWDFPPDRVVLEITETALMADPAASTARLHELRALGTRISIDDFGTGYSSLAYLRNLPADEMKIDRSFIQPISTSEADRRIVQSIVGLGHAIGLKVVAEGVEDASVVAALQAMSCDTGQGYFYSRPLEAREFESRWIGSTMLATAPRDGSQIR